MAKQSEPFTYNYPSLETREQIINQYLIYNQSKVFMSSWKSFSQVQLLIISQIKVLIIIQLDALIATPQKHSIKNSLSFRNWSMKSDQLFRLVLSQTYKVANVRMMANECSFIRH